MTLPLDRQVSPEDDGLTLPPSTRPVAPALSVVIPLYNEERRVPALCDAARRWNTPFGAAELILVDDGCTDRTVRMLDGGLLDCRVPHRVISHAHNRGKGAAVATGMRQARGDFVAFLDADLAVTFEDLARAMSMMESAGALIAVGSRRHPDSELPDPQPVIRRTLGRCFNLAARTMGLASMSDTQCGMKLFRRMAAAQIFPHVKSEGFAFDVEVLRVAELYGHKVIEVPVTWHHRGESKVRPVRDGAAMLRSLVTIRRRWGKGSQVRLMSSHIR